MDDSEINAMEDIELPEAMWRSRPARGSAVPGEGDALWSYTVEGRINGIPVKESDRHCRVESDDDVAEAFRLVRHPRSLMFRAVPGEETQASAYDRLLEKVYDGSAVIVDEIRQFDPNSGAFVAWVRYDELEYELHPRWNHLRED